MIYVLVYNPAEIYGRWPDHDYLPMFVPPPPNFSDLYSLARNRTS
jgi:hypothetical protein